MNDFAQGRGEQSFRAGHCCFFASRAHLSYSPRPAPRQCLVVLGAVEGGVRQSTAAYSGQQPVPGGTRGSRRRRRRGAGRAAPGAHGTCQRDCQCTDRVSNTPRSRYTRNLPTVRGTRNPHPIAHRRTHRRTSRTQPADGPSQAALAAHVTCQQRPQALMCTRRVALVGCTHGGCRPAPWLA